MNTNLSGKIALGVVIPVYNEAECIEEVIASWHSFLSNYLGDDKYIILTINDGSKDDTPRILDSLLPKYKNLRVLHQKNGGHGNAVINGYRTILEHNTDYVFQVDSDNQFLPEDFPKLWENRLKSNFILGYRKKRYDEFNRLIITRIVRLINLLFFGVYILDCNIPYRLIKSSHLNGLLGVIPSYPFAPNIFLSVAAKRYGDNLLNIPVTHKERETGQVSIIKWKLLKVCFQSAKELFSFSLSLGSKIRALKKKNG